MSSITPAIFAPLYAVHHLILDELIASAPLSVLTLCSAVYKRVTAVLYADIESSPDVFCGLELQEGYERTVQALQSTKTIRIRDFTGIDTLYSLAGPQPDQQWSAPSPSSSSNDIHPYPRQYTSLFPSLKRLELGFPALKSSFHEYLEMLESSNPALEEDETLPFNFLARRLVAQLPSGVMEAVFHLSRGAANPWYEVDQHLFFQAPRQAIILLKAEIEAPTEADGATFGRLGEELPTEWPNAERLRVFVTTQKPWPADSQQQREMYILSMGRALATYAKGLTWRVDLGLQERALGDEGVMFKLVEHVEIHFPFSRQVLAEMDKEGRSVVDLLVKSGKLVLEEFDEGVRQGLGLMDGWEGGKGGLE
ncbi:hypothetical protein IAR50_007274 [Cryptococcus sp. DSM 104548]